MRLESKPFDPKEIVRQLCYLQKNIAELQLRLATWSVKTAEDRNAVRTDVDKIVGTVGDLAAEAGRYEEEE